MGGTQLISQTRGSTTNYFLQDGQNSTRALTNSSGNVTDTYSYTAFGELFNQTGSTTNSYLYTGQQFDSLTGLYDLRARYYNPALGRFLSQDTFAVNFSNPVELNRYVYTGNSPINRTDPSGQFFIDTAILKRNAIVIGGALVPVGRAAYLYFARAGWIVASYLPQLLSLNADQVFDLISTGQIIWNWLQNYGTSLQTQPQQAPTPTQATETPQLGREVQLFGFRGVASNPQYANEQQLIKWGHVGISFDGGKTIYGFHPSEISLSQFKSPELAISYLRNGGTLPGQVYNDTSIFLRAAQLADQGAIITTVYRLPIPVSEAEYNSIRASVISQVENPSLTTAEYSLPDTDGPVSYMPAGYNNCATWPQLFGLPIPELSGHLKYYIEAMKSAPGATVWHP